MEHTTTAGASSEAVIDDFFTRAAVLRHPTLLSRAREVRQRLETYLDTEGERVLTTGELLAVAREREHRPRGAVARATAADALLCALPGFLEPHWFPPDRAGARAQVLVVEGLLRWLHRPGVMDLEGTECGFLAAEVQVRRARERLRRQPEMLLRVAPVAG